MRRRNDGKRAAVDAFVKAVDDEGTATEVEVFGMTFVRISPSRDDREHKHNSEWAATREIERLATAYCIVGTIGARRAAGEALLEALMRERYVDWLDEGRESCLIDGVRYTRADFPEDWRPDWRVTEQDEDGRVVEVQLGSERYRLVGRNLSEAWVWWSGRMVWIHDTKEDAETDVGTSGFSGKAVRILVPIDQHPEGGET